MELYELRPATDAYRPGLAASFRPVACRLAHQVHGLQAVFIDSFNLYPRSAVINTETGLYIESSELAERLVASMATGVVPPKAIASFSRRVAAAASGRRRGRGKSSLCRRA
ncbi:hypothetical protein [Bosea sp. BIWAKO-01]|uniref:hypothetical protein n=1 Tax=Bosea sp. BIWAKO-01 TaxID=506668 RepID=UPI000852CCC5|nr:hypothetical protein [Bosea sp. BIWAKO-01]